MMTTNKSNTTAEPVTTDVSKGNAIEITNLKKSFNQQTVLNGISLNVAANENLVVLGKSGSGKSVLIKCIVGLLSSDDGEIKVFGNNVLKLNPKEMAEMRKKIGFLFQSGALYDSMTVKQNLEFPLRRIMKKLTEQEIKEKIEEVLENVGLAESLNKKPSQLSGGMRKRISLARTIVVDPMIILYDEPTTGLDPVTSDEISMLMALAEIMLKINSGEGTLGRLIQDTTIADNLDQTMENLNNSTKGLDENMEAAKSNILLRGYYNKKAKAAEDKKKAAEQKKKEELEKKNK